MYHVVSRAQQINDPLIMYLGVSLVDTDLPSSVVQETDSELRTIMIGEVMVISTYVGDSKC